jgi:hypothetical protein
MVLLAALGGLLGLAWLEWSLGTRLRSLAARWHQLVCRYQGHAWVVHRYDTRGNPSRGCARCGLYEVRRWVSSL